MTQIEFEARIEILETRLSHQEASIEELTLALLRQEQALKQQAQIVERLQVQLRALATSPVAPSEDEIPPPHY